MTNIEFGSRVLFALVAGLLIGFERQWHHKSVSFKTNGLVAAGAALYVMASVAINGNVTQIVGQVVVGIGFLGAGIIFREGNNVHGLTTAVTVWSCGAIGCLAAIGNFSETAIATALILTSNFILIPIDEWLANRENSNP